jgi:hypothetical protein
MENFTEADRVFLCRLAFHGPFGSIDRPLFYKRLHPKNWYLNRRDRMAWFNPYANGKAALPHWLQVVQLKQRCRNGADPAAGAGALRRDLGALGCTLRAEPGEGPLRRRGLLRSLGRRREAAYNWK